MVTDTNQTRIQRMRTRIIGLTHPKLRPLLVVAVIVCGMVVAQACAVVIFCLDGEIRSINFGFIGHLGVCMSAAALTYGLLAPILSDVPRVGSWILGMAMSLAFWLAATFAAPQTGIKSKGDLVALALLIIGSGIFAGWMIWLERKSRSS